MPFSLHPTHAIKRAFFRLSGAGTETLERCPSLEQRKYFAFGATVLVPCALSSRSSWESPSRAAREFPESLIEMEKSFAEKMKFEEQFIGVAESDKRNALPEA